MPDLVTIAARVIAMLFVLPIHECAHACAASMLGDNTAKLQGRATLNPFKHLDVMGTLCLVLIGFGWAKPVPINPYNFKHRKYGMALSALAGPVSNFLLAFAVLAVLRIIALFSISGTVAMFTVTVLITIAQISIVLGVFNLLPAPPLDGSRILLLFLPEKYYFMIMKYERYISIAVMILVVSGLLSRPLAIASQWMLDGMLRILAF